MVHQTTVAQALEWYSKPQKVDPYALLQSLSATNNEAEYEALLAGLRLAKDLGIIAVEIYCDSQLFIC